VRINAVVSNAGLELLVVDRGSGIPPALRTAILEPFHRLGNEQAGIGLGLTVVSGFVQLLGGSLRFEDTPGGGLTVVIELPNAIEARNELVDASSPAEGLSAPVGE
jgi:two-component system, OmpR family, sensor histidine kinase KdpD